MSDPLIFLPHPQRLTFLAAPLELTPHQLIWLGPGVPLAAGRVVRNALAVTGPRWRLTSARLDGQGIGAALSIDPAAVPQPEGYHLTIDRDGITIVGHDAAGVFYAAQTLWQLIWQVRPAETTVTLPGLRIEDWPDFPQRGVMLDISRDKVPSVQTLYHLVELLAGWKINQLQLYTEHTFAYRNHRTVWAEASPLTGEEIMELDAFCRAHFITLVPNQNSFGHMTRWLKHAAYAHLAEAPDGFTFPWGVRSDQPFSLCPTDPAAIQFVAGLYDELLPHFSADLFNVGCDETWDVGQPGTRSEAAVRAQGEGRVYLDFLRQIHGLVSERGRVMQFWGDIIVKHPELIPELPADAIALSWGYEADHPFDQQASAFAAAGLDFYVCPGTSSWNAIAGRTDNARGNLWNAAENGRKHGASGYLNTDWGDNGHWQPLPVSYLGFAYGAAVSWAAEANRDLDLPHALDRFAFHDEGGVMGRLAYDLGNVYQVPDMPIPNSSVLFRLLLHPDVPLNEAWISGLSMDKLTETEAAIEGIMAHLSAAKMLAHDAGLVADEFTLAANLLSHACRLGKARLAAPGQVTARIPAATREALAEELGHLVMEYRRVWMARNRLGGLGDSVALLAKAMAAYRQE